jgi:hypothetical protein
MILWLEACEQSRAGGVIYGLVENWDWLSLTEIDSGGSSPQIPKRSDLLWELRRHPTAACGWLRAGV